MLTFSIKESDRNNNHFLILESCNHIHSREKKLYLRPSSHTRFSFLKTNLTIQISRIKFGLKQNKTFFSIKNQNNPVITSTPHNKQISLVLDSLLILSFNTLDQGSQKHGPLTLRTTILKKEFLIKILIIFYYAVLFKDY